MFFIVLFLLTPLPAMPCLGMSNPGKIVGYHHNSSTLHPWSLKAKPLPYQRTREQCYQHPKGASNTTAAVVLLPHTPVEMPVLHGGGISKLLANTPADVILFHTGWSELEIDALRAAVPLPFRALCISNEDWDEGQYAFDWEFVQQAYHGHGYRNMCRWYSRRVRSSFDICRPLRAVIDLLLAVITHTAHCTG
jgi:hypothetical protein